MFSCLSKSCLLLSFFQVIHIDVSQKHVIRVLLLMRMLFRMLHIHTILLRLRLVSGEPFIILIRLIKPEAHYKHPINTLKRLY